MLFDTSHIRVEKIRCHTMVVQIENWKKIHFKLNDNAISSTCQCAHTNTHLPYSHNNFDRWPLVVDVCFAFGSMNLMIQKKNGHSIQKIIFIHSRVIESLWQPNKCNWIFECVHQICAICLVVNVKMYPRISFCQYTIFPSTHCKKIEWTEKWNAFDLTN